MKKIVLSTALLMALSSSGFAFGMPSIPSLGGGSSSTSSVNASDITTVIKLFNDADTGLNKSVDLINNSLADKKEIAKWNEKEKTINAMPASGEKDAEMKKLNEDQLAYATKLAESKEAQQKAKNLSSEQKQNITKAIGNVLLAALKDKKALDTGKGLVSSISSNPSTALKFASDLPKLKDIVSNVPSQLTALSSFSSGLMSLAKSSDIKVVQPQSADEELKPVDF